MADPEGFQLRQDGNGVFTTKDFKAGECLLAFKDPFIPDDEAKTQIEELNKQKKDYRVTVCKYEEKVLVQVSVVDHSLLATCVDRTSWDFRVNCEIRCVRVPDTETLVACIFAKKDLKQDCELFLKEEKDLKKIGWLVGIGVGVGAGIGAIIAAPFVLAGIGFTAGGIAAGSFAASMMSSAAVSSGGGVAAGSLVALLQSAGAVGIGAGASAAIGTTAGVAAAGLTKVGFVIADMTKEVDTAPLDPNTMHCLKMFAQLNIEDETSSGGDNRSNSTTKEGENADKIPGKDGKGDNTTLMKSGENKNTSPVNCDENDNISPMKSGENDSSSIKPNENDSKSSSQSQNDVRPKSYIGTLKDRIDDES